RGRKCSVRGKLNGKTSEVLWDTGAQVSIVSENFVSKTFPNIPIRDVSELLECGLTLTAANGSKIPYVGWVELKFQVQDSANEVSVPFLVTRENLELPLVGFNVIEHMINSGTLQENDILTGSFVGINTHNAVTLLDLSEHWTPEPTDTRPVLFEADENGHWPGGLQVSDNLLTVKAGKASKIEVEIRNTTKHDISLKGRTVLGRLQLVQSVAPVEVKLKAADPKSRIPPSTKSTDDVSEDKIRGCTSNHLPAHLKEIDLSRLTNEQKKVAEQLLIEQADAFAQSDDDVGSIPNLELNIHLNDKTPVQKNYVAVPRPLYPEVKAYIEDMLNRKFIRRSNS
ncbi:Retrovirus-related Pol poly from transposon, partial [Paramuricea clavata]